MIKVVLATLVLGGAGATGAVVYTVTDGSISQVEICHATASETTPYVGLRVDVASVDGTGGNDRGGQGDHYLEHRGAIGPLQSGHWGDIIPPIEGVHEGLNWTPEGQAIHAAGCGSPTSATEPATSSSEPPVEGSTTVTQHQDDLVTPPSETPAPTSAPTTTEPATTTLDTVGTQPTAAESDGSGGGYTSSTLRY